MRAAICRCTGDKAATTLSGHVAGWSTRRAACCTIAGGGDTRLAGRQNQVQWTMSRDGHASRKQAKEAANTGCAVTESGQARSTAQGRREERGDGRNIGSGPSQARHNESQQKMLASARSSGNRVGETLNIVRAAARHG